MKKVNFNTITELKTPESRIERALKIPEEYESKQAAVIPFRRRLIAAAAVLVVVSAVSVSLILSFGRSPVEVLPTPVEEPTAPTGAYDGAFTPDPSQSGNADDPGQGLSHAADDAAYQPTSSGASESSTGDTSTAQPFIGPTQPPTTPYDKPVSRPTQTVTEGGSLTPTEHTADPTTVSPTHPSTEKPTQKPIEIPTEAIIDPPTETPIATDTPSESSTTATEPEEWMLVRYSITKNLFAKSGTAVYCKITDRTGKIVYGDPDLYSDYHRATEVHAGPVSVTYRYDPGDHGLVLIKNGLYRYYFYDANGKSLSVGTFYNR